MGKRNYPLNIENWGEDVYILASRGHHPFEAFMRKVREFRSTWPMGHPEHLWMKAIPDRYGDYICKYVQATPTTRGAFPVTYTQENYGPDRYFLPEEKDEQSKAIAEDQEASKPLWGSVQGWPRSWERGNNS